MAVSIFVNPLQFGDPDDIANYPRTLERDLSACAGAGADLVFVPTVAEMYPTWPEPPATTVSRRRGERRLGGRRRDRATSTAWPPWWPSCSPSPAPAGPTSARRTSSSWPWCGAWRSTSPCPVEVVGCPTVREADGLALSSRNVRLAPAERAAATVLSRALAAGRAAVERRRALGRGAARRHGRAWSPPSRWSSWTTPPPSTPTTLVEPETLADPAPGPPAGGGPGGAGPPDRQLRRPGRRRCDATKPSRPPTPRDRRGPPPSVGKDRLSDAPPHDEVQDPPGHGDRGQPRLRRLGLASTPS